MGETKFIKFRAFGIWGRKEGEQSGIGSENQEKHLPHLLALSYERCEVGNKTTNRKSGINHLLSLELR